MTTFWTHQGLAHSNSILIPQAQDEEPEAEGNSDMHWWTGSLSTLVSDTHTRGLPLPNALSINLNWA